MKSFILTVSLFVCLTLGVSNAQPLPDCLDKFGEDKFNSWNNCTHSVGTEGSMWSFIFKNGEAVFGYMDYKDGKYSGAINKEQQRHGNGGFVFDNGDMYSGNWRYDKRYGQGTYTYANRDKYVGEWKDGKMHGQGTYTQASGQKYVYVGEWKNSLLNGQAAIYGPDGIIIKEGIFKDNELVYAQNNELIQSYKIVCEELGFKPKTVDFGNCVLKMMELNKD